MKPIRVIVLALQGTFVVKNGKNSLEWFRDRGVILAWWGEYARPTVPMQYEYVSHQINNEMRLASFMRRHHVFPDEVLWVTNALETMEEASQKGFKTYLLKDNTLRMDRLANQINLHEPRV